MMRYLLSILILALALVTAPLCGTAQAQWGDLTATFVFDGPIPDPVPVVPTKDVQVCGKHKLIDESLVVNKENGGIANVIVYVYTRTGEEVPAHPDFEKTAKDKVMLDNKECRFAPHVAVLRTSQTLEVGNSDAVGHNTKVDTFVNSPINPVIPAGGKLEHQFTDTERLPAKVSCSIHPWMNAWVVIKDHPYVAVSDKNGKLTIKNLPAGKWTFQVWQEKAGYVQQVKQNGKATSWRRGRVEVEIKPGSNDLGTIKIAPDVFEK